MPTPATYALDPSDLTLDDTGYGCFTGNLPAWLVDADGRCTDDGEGDIEATVTFDTDSYGRCDNALDVYAVNGGHAITLHADVRGELLRACEALLDAREPDCDALFDCRDGVGA